MAEKKRLQIGLMIHHLENEYASEILKGAIAAAEELDINLILLPGRGINAIEDDEKYSIYDYQYNVIYHYVSTANLDGLLVSVGTVGSYISRDEMLQFLHSYDPLPLLTMEVAFPEYPCIRFNTDGMKLAVEHLIHHHGCRNIGYVSGPMGNQDAMDRLYCYREVLEENHIPYDRTKVVYGNFSEASEEVVRELLEMHPDLEAVCFANDKMCIGGYHVFQQRGMRVGRDILVTGFDDSEVATSLKPMLTTVRTNISSMGYQAVQEMVRMIRTGHAESKILDACLIVRESCDVTAEQMRSIGDDGTADDVVSQIFNKYIGDLESAEKTEFVQDIWALMTKEFQTLYSGEQLEAAPYAEALAQLFRRTDVIPVHVPLLKKIITYAKVIAVQISRGNQANILAAEQIHEAFLDHLLDYSMQQQYLLRTNLTYSNFLISNINKDMMINSNDEEKSFFSIVKNLYRVNFKSSYIYVFQQPVVHYQYDEWIMPKNLYLKSYHVGRGLHRVEPPEQQVSVYHCISNRYMPRDRRYTVVMVPLFSNEEQYGLFICELDYNHFSQIYSVAPQICSAIKMTRLVKELEGSLEAARFDNRRLKLISDSDELTGVYNRRGFYRVSNMMLESPEYVGKPCVLILADLDNLKIINDTFGHDGGDHALKMCVQYLSSAVPLLDAIGRVGGDEFAGFAVVDNAETAGKTIYDSIKRAAEQYNATSDIPYNITLSVGVCTLQCRDGEQIQNYVKFADQALYQDKKNKNRVVIKPKKA